jgi:hypothetical protein
VQPGSYSIQWSLDSTFSTGVASESCPVSVDVQTSTDTTLDGDGAVCNYHQRSAFIPPTGVLEPTKIYYVRMAFDNTAGISSYTTPVVSGPILGVPGKSENVAFYMYDETDPAQPKVKITWDEPSSTGDGSDLMPIKGYNIQHSTDEAFITYTGSSLETSDTSFEITTPLDEAIKYYVRVKAITDVTDVSTALVDATPWSDTASFTMCPRNVFGGVCLQCVPDTTFVPTGPAPDPNEWRIVRQDAFEECVCNVSAFTLDPPTWTCGCHADTYESTNYTNIPDPLVWPICLSCPAGKTSTALSKNVSYCKCPAGSTGPDGDESCSVCLGGTYKSDVGSAVCDNCDAGTFSHNGSVNCTSCPAQTSSVGMSDALTDCVCVPGYSATSPGFACSPCAINSFKALSGSHLCTPCDTQSGATVSTGAIECVCAVGYYNQTAGCIPCPSNTSTATVGSSRVEQCECTLGFGGTHQDECVACPEDTFKYNISNTICIECGNFSSTSSLVTGSTQCLCVEYFINSVTKSLVVDRANQACSFGGDFNIVCEAGTWLNNYFQCIPCPTNSSSSSNSTDVTDCKCVTGYTGVDGGPCIACEIGTYKNTTGPGGCTPCPLMTMSPMGSDELVDCVCLGGYFH